MSYGMLRCGAVEVTEGVLRTSLGPNRETCMRQDGHPFPCSAATPKWDGTVFWDGLDNLDRKKALVSDAAGRFHRYERGRN